MAQKEFKITIRGTEHTAVFNMYAAILFSKEIGVDGVEDSLSFLSNIFITKAGTLVDNNAENGQISAVAFEKLAQYTRCAIYSYCDTEGVERPQITTAQVVNAISGDNVKVFGSLVSTIIGALPDAEPVAEDTDQPAETGNGQSPLPGGD
jgi:hypothetical protein